jgi:thiol-disulfide isomerase/thioredoxin
MKKIGIVLLSICLVLFSYGCTKGDSNSALSFKEEYEALNGEVNSSGKEHRTVSISEDNPYEEITPGELIEKINNDETFYVYFGDPLCPWCRSVIEKSIEVAKNNGVEKIYYIKIWDSEGNEVLRSKYQLNDENMPELVSPATDEYYEILRAFNDVLDDYTLTTSDGDVVDIGEKRIYAPSFVYVSNGEAVKLETGISDKQTDSREELTDEILLDEENLFNEFFNNEN